MRREFPVKVKMAAWKRCQGLCEKCHCKLYPGHFQYDHDKEDTYGGEPTLENCKVLCTNCHRDKTTSRQKDIAKSNRVIKKHAGMKKTRNPLPGSRASKWKRKMDGTIVRR